MDTATFMSSLNKSLDANIELHLKLRPLLPEIEAIGKLMAKTILSGNKILICGNGGSAADAQHMAAELVGRFVLERKGLPAIALTTDSSILTAVGNDYGFESIFSRQVEALGNNQDMLIAISTSGSSPNVLKAVAAAKRKAMLVVGLAGKDGGLLKRLSHKSLVIPSENTARIQEAHLFVYHNLCSITEIICKERENELAR